jgi:hypothetical protein
VVSRCDGEQTPRYPIADGVPLEPSVEEIKVAGTVPLRETTVVRGMAAADRDERAVEDPHRVEGLAVGGSREVPVRW